MCIRDSTGALPEWTPLAWHSVPWIVLVGVTALSAHYCLARALTLADAAVVVPLDFLRLPLVAVVGWLVWDERLDDLNIDIIPAAAQPGQRYWKVIKAEFQNSQEGGGRHHIFIEVLDEAGKRIVGQPVEVLWSDGSATVYTEDKPAPEYAANFPMYGNLGGYALRIPGLSETVTGMGLPGGKQHVVYNVVFQRVTK